MQTTRVVPANTDFRGSISDILTGENFDAATIITSRRGAVRGNHYHKDTIQWTYVLTGRVRVAAQVEGQERHEIEIGPGELVRHDVLEAHSILAVEDSTFLVLTRGPRSGEDYESDTYRLENPLHPRSSESPAAGAMIPVNEPLIGEAAHRYVGEVMSSGWISSEGPFLTRFEKEWAEWCGAEYGVAVCNGTAALEIAMGALDFKPGDEVIMPTFTIISCALAVIEAGATPVLVDSDPVTWCMDVEQVRQRVTPRTRAILAVHMYGHPAELDPLREIAAEAGVDLIEDAAEAHGATYKGKRVGAFGRMSCFSFYANKIITTGEGGMVLCRTEEDAERLRSLRNLCFRKDRRFWHTELGHNFRMTNLQAALGVAQVEQIDDHIRRKKAIAAHYGARLSGLAGLQLPAELPHVSSVFWMYGVVLDESLPLDATQFAHELRKRGVDTRPFFIGMHEQPALRDRGLFAGERHPVAERLARRGFYLPTGLTLTDAQLDRVCDAVAAVHG
ncbi:MAG TPA: DegT/DnrJ/EryC1/StrS family aminotransferase [Thermoanaerobaculia bacterium]|nr:DegT/DnrJ/EryC1/StrS family aminotransferase [Thermoanaerobaculia bacterium]